MEKRHLYLKIGITLAVLIATVLIIGGLLGKDSMYHLNDRSSIGPLTREDVTLVRADTPASSAADGTVNAADWESTFPYIAATMHANDANDELVDYLEQDPYLVSIYEGYGFAKDYKGARGHEYALEDVSSTERPHKTANCLTCKTPNLAKLVQDEGIGVYTRPFDEVFSLMEENVSCYTCHGNNAGNQGELVVTHTYVNTALGANAVSEIDPATLSCGQCHIEYYFVPGYNEAESKITYTETMMPYNSVDAMTPGAILEYYDSMQMPDGTVGFYDWIQPSTGTRMLKAQHPEMETYLSGLHAQQTLDGRALNCADCHMAIEMAEDGTVYHSHELVSPLENETLLATCARCHGSDNVVQAVHRIQQQVTQRESAVGNKLADMKQALADAVAAGTRSEDELDAIRKLYREAQWFFDYAYVENSEGFHGWTKPVNGENTDVSNRCLDIAEEKIEEAMALLNQ